VGGRVGQPIFIIRNLTGRRVIETGYAVQQAGFTRTVRPDNRRNQAGFDFHAHFGQRSQTAERQRDVINLQCGHIVFTTRKKVEGANSRPEFHSFHSIAYI